MRIRTIKNLAEVGRYPMSRGGIANQLIPAPTFHAPFSDPSNPLYVERGGALTMVRATTATYLHPTTGLITSAANNILRIEANGALIEATRTNLSLQSQTLGTTWTPTDVTVANNDGVSPDGTTNAELLTSTAGNGTLIQDLGVVASAAKTFSIYLKRKTGTGNIDLTLNNGGTWTTKTITTSWARYEITATVADPDVGIRIVTSGDAIWAWGGQLENLATYASSYIPTVAASVTRNGDALKAPNSSIDATNGSVVVQVDAQNTAGGFIVSIDGDNRILYYNNQLKMYDGTTVIQGDNVLTAGTSYKVGAIWANGGNMGLYRDGAGDGTPNSFDGFVLSDFLDIGNNGGGAQIDGHIKNLRIWSIPLSDARMQGLTS